MININIINLYGHITRDIELEIKEGSGLAIAKFGLGVSRMKKDDPSDFFNVVAFSKTAELIADSLHKGSPILITGHMQMNKYTDKEGNKRTSADVIVDRFEFVGKKEDNNSTNSNSNSDIKEADKDLHIPF